MNARNKIVTKALIIGFIAILILEILCRFGIKCKNCGRISRNKEFSKKEGFYIGDYIPQKTDTKLKYYDQTIKFDTAWLERRWHINSNICLLKFKVINEWQYNFILPFQKSKPDEHLFSLTPIIRGYECSSCGSIGKTKKEFRILERELSDTLKFVLKEKNLKSGVGWNEPLRTDTLIYIMKK